jgi:hypothetical protein
MAILIAILLEHGKSQDLLDWHMSVFLARTENLPPFLFFPAQAFLLLDLA